MATTYLSQTFSTTGTSTTKFTFSAWIKRANIGATNRILTAGGSTRDGLVFGPDVFQFFCGSNVSGEVNPFVTNRKFRDTSGWYHIVVSGDSTQSGASNQVKLYVNGVLETSFSSQQAVGINTPWYFGSNILNRIGTDTNSLNGYFDGSMSHVHFSDGYIYPASTFGSTDATTGEWKINANPTFTLGTNGYTILKDGNTITDQSTNSNNWTLGAGTLTNTEDNPSDVFCTLNPLNNTVSGSSPVFSYGNNMVLTGTSSADFGGSGTLGLKKGIWYYEGLVVTSGDDNLRSVFGINSDPAITAKSNQEGQWNRWSYCWKGYLGQWWTNANATPGNGTNNDGYLNTYTNGDYIGVYFDLDNSKMLFTKNGVLERSGVSMAITPVADTDSGFYFPIYTDGHSGWSSSAKLNFGNGVFGSTALTGTEDTDWFRDAGGKGKFKYNPTQTIDSTTWNARAICLKNINTYG